MVRTAVLLAGLGAALVIAGLAAVRSEAVGDASQAAWVEQHVQEVTAGQSYRLDGCLTVTALGLEAVSLHVAWYADPDGYGSALDHDEFPGNPWLVGSEQCLSLADAEAPCEARSARYGVVANWDTDAVEVSSLEFALEPEATPIPCPTTPPSPTPTPTPQPTPSTNPPPTATPPPLEPTTTPPAPEPKLFPSLVNGGFEEVREDGTPYGWRKIGGEMSTSEAFRAEGERSAALASRTDSTKWVYQTVSVQGASYYRLQALALKNDPGVREVLLRLSWYESADGSGSQIGTADSKTLAEDSPAFVALDTGPLQAPPRARSAKVRLLLRPASAAPATVYFDSVRFGETDAPMATSADDEGQAHRPAGGREAPPSAGGGRPADGEVVAQAPPAGAVLSAWTGPTLLANVEQERHLLAAPAAGGGRPLWPLLLAFGVPALALATVAGHAWWRARLAGRNNGRL